MTILVIETTLFCYKTRYLKVLGLITNQELGLYQDFYSQELSFKRKLTK